MESSGSRPSSAQPTATTDSTKVSWAVSEPSVTLTVIVVLPAWPATGVSVTVRLVPEPPNAIPLLGTSAVFEELPETTTPEPPVCASST